MKKVIIFIFAILSIFFLTLCNEKTDEAYTNTDPSPKEATIDTPVKTYERRIEAQSIANTIQNPGNYLGSRVEARGSSKNAVEQSNKRTEAQDKAMADFLK